LAKEGEQWENRAGEARERIAEAAEDAEAARAAIDRARGQEQAARLVLQVEEGRLSRLAAQVEAREAVESGYEGFAPAVAALMAERKRFPGVLAPLADFIPAEVENAEALESYLGPLLQGRTLGGRRNLKLDI
jgi:chromosome segregation protein